jgi:leucyl-tRNA synthetase
MELLNAVNKLDHGSPQSRAVEREALDAVVLVLSPIVPHICHALWTTLGHDTAPVDERWPAFDESALEQDMIEIVVQVNGKLRGRIPVPADADQDTIAAQALADPNVLRFTEGKEIRKTIVVPGRLVNIVV